MEKNKFDFKLSGIYILKHQLLILGQSVYCILYFAHRPPFSFPAKEN